MPTRSTDTRHTAAMVFDVVVVGAAGVDTLVYLPEGEPDFSRDSTMVHTVDTVGQAGAFSARGFARLGWRTGFVGAFGADWAAHLVRTAFAADGVTVAAEVLDPAGTARSVNLMTSDGRRRAFYDGRGHAEVPVPEVGEVFRGARLAMFHLSDWCRKLLAPARAASCTIAVDLQDLDDVADPYRRDFIEAADVVFFSAAHIADPRQTARDLLAKGPRLAVAGLGAAGALLAWREPDGAIVELVLSPAPVLDLPIVDTNGAGDGLAVGTLHELLLTSATTGGFLRDTTTEDLSSAVLSGQCAARWTCMRRGGDHLITRSDLATLRTLIS